MARAIPSVISRLLAAALAVGFGVSCQNMGGQKNSLSAHAQLKLTPPKGKIDGPDREKWLAIDQGDGQHFVQAKDGMDDVVTFYGIVSAYDSTLKDLGGLEAQLRSDESMHFERLRHAEVLGVPVLRFEKVQEDNGPGDESVRAALKVRGRTLAGPYHVRTIGALLLHPTESGRFVTVACARASYHGEIGTYYEELFEDYLSNFVADNALANQRFE